MVTEVDADYRLKAAIIRGHELLAQKDSRDSSYYYLNNAHGDVTALVDGRGEVANRYRYDAFGNTVEAKEQIPNRFRYAGEQFDAVTGQYYLRARFYNPVVGRFTQEDTYRGDGLNLYAYVQNNPVKYVDPSGYSCESKSNVYAGVGGDNLPKIGSKTGYKFKEGVDLDFRGTGKTYKDALDEAFSRTGVPKEDFVVVRWAKDANGKSFPVEWRAKGGAEVSIDIGHVKPETPDFAHVGYKTPGKGKNKITGHIFVDDVPVNR